MSLSSQPLACGTWPSPLSPEAAAAGITPLAHVGMAHGKLCWVEGRPQERGRSVLMGCGPDGQAVELLPADTDVRTRVHEYGGMPWTAVGTGWLYAQFNDQQLRRVDADGRSTTLTPPGCRYADFDLAPDGRRVVCVREDHRAGGEPRNSVVWLDPFSSDGSNGSDRSGQVLNDGHDFVAWPRWRRDGRALACVGWSHPAMPWDETELQVAMVDGDTVSAWQTVAGGPGESVLEPQWDTDGSLYFLSDRSGWWNLYRWCDGSVQAVTSLEAELGGALWQLGTSTYVLLGDGRALLRVGRGTVESLNLIDLSSGRLLPLPLPYVAYSALGRMSPGQVHALASARDGLPALIQIDVDTGEHTVRRSSGTAPLAPDAVSPAQAIEFSTAPGADGLPRTAHAWFYPPWLPGQRPLDTERPPLIVMLHGGPTSNAGPAFKVGVQFWTSRGFAVVDVNYGGSTGFGRAYRERLRGQWGVVDLQDTVAAVDHLVAEGRVDGRRVAIRGGSAGGFTVLSALVFTDRFAAGINYYGVADLVSLASDTHKFESRYIDSLVAPLPEGLPVYEARSPVRHMARCQAALITFQGSEDRAVPPQQSRDIVAAARSAGCPVAYVEFEGEGHGFRQAPNIVLALQNELVFLGRVFAYLPPGPLPSLHIDNEAALAHGPDDAAI
jgi:dipeptidyl aminopeptidase/acylaminoacyl peptidase